MEEEFDIDLAELAQQQAQIVHEGRMRKLASRRKRIRSRFTSATDNEQMVEDQEFRMRLCQAL